MPQVHVQESGAVCMKTAASRVGELIFSVLDFLYSCGHKKIPVAFQSYGRSTLLRLKQNAA